MHLLIILYFVFKVNFAYVEHGEKKNTLIKLSMYDYNDLFPTLTNTCVPHIVTFFIHVTLYVNVSVLN